MLLAGGVAASLDAFSECTEVMNEKYVCEAGLVSLEKFQGSRWKFNYKDGNSIGVTKGWVAFLTSLQRFSFILMSSLCVSLTL